MIRKKILTPAHLINELKNVRSKKARMNKIVFTNGVFDVLHAGHVTYLEKARALGTILVVAINADDSVKRLKGPTRPLNSLLDRQQVVAALESVSYVTYFSEDTPLNLIKKILPDVLVKGGDYVAKDIVGFAEVTEAGGKVKVLPFLQGRSTTLLIEKAKTNI